MYVQRNIEARSYNHLCRGNARSITYSECVSAALGIRNVKCMCRTILSYVVCPTVQYCCTLSHTRYNFRSKSSWT